MSSLTAFCLYSRFFFTHYNCFHSLLSFCPHLYPSFFHQFLLSCSSLFFTLWNWGNDRSVWDSAIIPSDYISFWQATCPYPERRVCETVGLWVCETLLSSFAHVIVFVSIFNVSSFHQGNTFTNMKNVQPKFHFFFFNWFNEGRCATKVLQDWKRIGS